MFSTLEEINSEEISKWKELYDKLVEFKFVGYDENIQLRKISPEE
jgi:hypothetical protein